MSKKALVGCIAASSFLSITTISAPASATIDPVDESPIVAESAVQSVLEVDEYYAVTPEGDMYIPPDVYSEVVGSRGAQNVSTEDDYADSEVVSRVSEYKTAVSSDALVGDSTASAATALWATCPIFESKYKLVKDYSRQTIAGVPGRTAHLRCGTQENWGYRHIKDRHSGQWADKAWYVGGDWRSFADWSLGKTFVWPCAKYRRVENNTLQYVKNIYLKDRRGIVISKFASRASVARVSQNVITAYPGKPLASTTC